MKKLSVIILAAGKGSRMNSVMPKVLHKIADKPMISHLLDTVFTLPIHKVYVVCGVGASQLQEQLKNYDLHWVHQSEQLGTGHAVQHVLPYLEEDEEVLVLYGDTPLTQQVTLNHLLLHKPEGGIALLTVQMADPHGYGRILRNEQGDILGIIEHKDASERQQQIREINTGIMSVAASELRIWLSRLTNDNAQQEFYLTDIIGFAHQDNKKIIAVHPTHYYETQGVNNKKQLAELERYYQKQQAEKLMLAGLTLLDPDRFDLRGRLTVGQDVVIDTNVIIKGEVSLGNNVRVDTGVVLNNCTVGDGVHILAYSIIEGAVIQQQASVGPFSRIRPDTVLKKNAHVGNFVELKKTELGENSKAGHLAYLGDAIIGNNVNIGAGTITCNYDGANKYQTIIEDDVFIGSDSQLIAPVRIAQGATIAAGSTIVKSVLEQELVLSRVKQRHISNWQRPTKKTNN